MYKLCINCFYILFKCKKLGIYKLLCSHRLPKILYSRIIKSF